VTLEPPARQCDAADAHCITCGDEGIPMEVRSSDESLARCVDSGGAEHEVVIDLVAPVTVGDRVLVHAGVAIGQLERAA
jgi:hydrogenase maturation factor